MLPDGRSSDRNLISLNLSNIPTNNGNNNESTYSLDHAVENLFMYKMRERERDRQLVLSIHINEESEREREKIVLFALALIAN